MAQLFDQTVSGPPPGGSTVGASLWVDMGAITTGKKHWFGSMRLTSPDKSITFELRSNTAGQSTGSTGTTTLHYAASVAPKNGTVMKDLYTKGRLHIATAVGTGTEHWWLRLTSKSGSAGSYLYDILYCLE